MSLLSCWGEKNIISFCANSEQLYFLFGLKKQTVELFTIEFSSTFQNKTVFSQESQANPIECAHLASPWTPSSVPLSPATPPQNPKESCGWQNVPNQTEMGIGDSKIGPNIQPPFLLRHFERLAVSFRSLLCSTHSCSDFPHLECTNNKK